ncbi:MAG: hypothetical protein GY833_22040 [Aestuariibacter sp.]|nr:hypothetical protein [Aestuariibacter sp.]|tara:strand:+ start:61473 stop:61691 length:219 start_codon:yes stop_codon:yes gene_type:complete
MSLSALLNVQETHAPRSAKQRFMERDQRMRTKSRAVVESLTTQRAALAEAAQPSEVEQPVLTNLTAEMLLND